MFDTLVASRSPRRAGRAGPLGALSVVLHAMVITGAVWGTARHSVVPTKWIPIDLPPAPSPRTAAPGNPLPLAPGPAGDPVLPVPSDPPIGIPPIDGGMAPIPSDWLRSPGTVGSAGGDPGSTPYTALTVDEPPEVLSGQPPRYPELLRQAGIEGRVVLEAVVDTTGRVEAGSIRVVASPHAAFVRPAREFAQRVLFRPARVGARAVRVLVRLPIDFTLRRR